MTPFHGLIKLVLSYMFGKIYIISNKKLFPQQGQSKSLKTSPGRK